MSLRKPRLLIVEDDPDVLLFLRLNLESAGYETSLAADGATAMRRIDKETPDLVVLDLMLPLMDGWAVLAELSQRPSPPAVVVCSARGSTVEQERAREMGVADYIVKPFSIEELLGSVQRALGQPGAEPDVLPEKPIEGIEPA